jgi:L-lactate permease
MYKLDFSRQGRATLAALDKDVAQRILIKLKWLVQNADNLSHVPLKGKLSGLYKLKIVIGGSSMKLSMMKKSSQFTRRGIVKKCTNRVNQILIVGFRFAQRNLPGTDGGVAVYEVKVHLETSAY